MHSRSVKWLSAATAITLAFGFYLGFKDDNWGWWYIPLTLFVITLFRVKRSSKEHAKTARALLIITGSIIGLILLLTAAWFVWLSSWNT